MVSHLAGGRIAAEPFPGAEAEEGAHSIDDHRDTGEELEEEHTPCVTTVAAPGPWPSPVPSTHGGGSSAVVVPLPPGRGLHGGRARHESREVQHGGHSVGDHQLGKAKRSW